MKSFFRFIRNIFFLAILAFGIWTYNTDPNVRIATNDSLATIGQRINQIVTTGNFNPPKLGDTSLKNSKTKNSSEKEESDTDAHTWTKPQANVYINMTNNPQLRSATVDAMNAWNRTGVFTFHEVSQKSKAQIIVSVSDDSSTSAAGVTSTTYNPVTDHLLRAHVHLNRYYLQNRWYGYSDNRITNTAEHELGHAIGLDHNNGVSVMYPKGSIYTIQPRDVKAVKKLYKES